ALKPKAKKKKGDNNDEPDIKSINSRLSSVSMTNSETSNIAIFNVLVCTFFFVMVSFVCCRNVVVI
ncbi:MAG: hypothetical protein ACI8RD_014885, partial [Bacillariaceae sp.]